MRGVAGEVWILETLAPLHVGEGATVGTVQLPVARERHTRWPWIPGAGIKGALRAWADQAAGDAEVLERAFGPPQDRADREARPGRLRFGPAYLLALSLRSLYGGAALVTCATAVARLARLLDLEADPPLPHAGPSLEGVMVCHDSSLVDEEHGVVLEDIALTPRPEVALEAWVRELATRFELDPALPRHFALVHDDLFDLACRAWLPIRTRASIGPDGVVAQGQLFTEEFVAPGTLFWTTVGGLEEAFLDLLPAPGEAWSLGGHGTVGAGRVAHHPPLGAAGSDEEVA